MTAAVMEWRTTVLPTGGSSTGVDEVVAVPSGSVTAVVGAVASDVDAVAVEAVAVAVAVDDEAAVAALDDELPAATTRDDEAAAAGAPTTPQPERAQAKPTSPTTPSATREDNVARRPRVLTFARLSFPRSWPSDVSCAY
jgi:hypothetical protein